MWVSQDGRFCTVALPRPYEALTPEALASYQLLRNAVGSDVISALLDTENESFSELAEEMSPDEGDEFAHETPVMGILDGDLGTPEDLVSAIRNISVRWRLDVLFAREDLNDGNYPGAWDR